MPSISVIIATRNRAESLKEVLTGLALQKTGGRFEYEVVVSDNSSSDSTRKIVEETRVGYPVPLKYLFESLQGKAHALNSALKIAVGEITVFLDDDVLIPENWLHTLFVTFEQYQADGVGGPTRPYWLSRRPEWLHDSLLRQLGMVNYGDKPLVVSDILTTFVGSNCAYKKELFLRYGEYSTTPGCAEDADWFRRLFRKGCKLVYQPRAAVLHKIDAAKITPAGIAGRFFRHGYSCAEGLRRERKGKVVFRVPLWTVREWFDLSGKAAKSWMAGKKQEALYYWLQRHFYRGMIAGCFGDWLRRKPVEAISRAGKVS